MERDYAELRRFRKRISDGGSSNRVTEALLEMYWRENLSVDEALKAYSELRFGSDMEAAERVCDEDCSFSQGTDRNRASGIAGYGSNASCSSQFLR